MVHPKQNESALSRVQGSVSLEYINEVSKTIPVKRVYNINRRSVHIEIVIRCNAIET